MILTQAHLDIIDRYVDNNLIDKDRLVKYLEKHKIIKNQVFYYCSRQEKGNFQMDFGYCMYCSTSEGYNPVDRETFIRRIPFYFYRFKEKDKIVYSHSLESILIPKDSFMKKEKKLSSEELEAIYFELEFMYYSLHLSCEEIFSYLPLQLNGVYKMKTAPQKESNSENNQSYIPRGEFGFLFSDITFDSVNTFSEKYLFPKWCHYLHLCEKLGWQDYMPERFLTKYNIALEASGLEPVIYDPLPKYNTRYFSREGNYYTCIGHFPTDENGMPILRWTSIKVHNPKSINYDSKKSSCGELRIELNPDTTILALNLYEYMSDEEKQSIDPSEKTWNQIYAGPLTMNFNNEALKEYRLYREMTQKELAKAVGASVRTYQKWESGETIPDGHNLLRLMNWLNITDIQQLVTYTEPIDNIKQEDTE